MVVGELDSCADPFELIPFLGWQSVVQEDR